MGRAPGRAAPLQSHHGARRALSTLEFQGLTRRDERALGAPLKRIMAHLLTQRYQPQRASRSRADSIAHGREEIADVLEQSPACAAPCPA
jgi:hypothetical protein